jgi:hypothetical protein
MGRLSRPDPTVTFSQVRYQKVKSSGVSEPLQKGRASPRDVRQILPGAAKPLHRARFSAATSLLQWNRHRV